MRIIKWNWLAVGCVAAALATQASTGAARASAPYPPVAITEVNGSSYSVAFLDVNSGALLTTVPVCEGADGLAFTPDGKWLYVACTDVHTVDVINVATHAESTFVNVDDGPVSVAPDPTGKSVYVGTIFGASVDVIKTATNTVSKVISLGGSDPDQSAGLAISPNGKVGITDVLNNGLLSFFNPSTGATSTQLTNFDGQHPTMIADTPNSKLAFVNVWDEGAIAELNLSTGKLVTTFTDPGTGPLGNAVDRTGTYDAVVNNASSDFAVIKISTGAVTGPFPTQSHPYGATFRDDGKALIVAEYGSGTVSEYDTSGTPLAKFTLPGGDPLAVAEQPDPAPTARFTFTAAPAGSTSKIDASSSSAVYGSVKSVKVNWGDGTAAKTISSPFTAQHTYATAGTYTVTATATDTLGTSTTRVGDGDTFYSDGGKSATHAQVVTIPAS